MSSAGSRRRWGEVFDDVADAYDEVRPGYPTKLVDAAIERGGLKRGDRVLEVGCGTGKLTEILVARGLRVDGVDPGPRMIERAKARVASSDSATFQVGRFEEVALRQGAFEAVFAAAAFHWLDPRVSWRKVASHLKFKGLLALFTYTSVQEERSAEADRGFRAVLRKHAPELATKWPPARALDTILAGAQERSGNASEVWDWVMGNGRHQLAHTDAARFFESVELAAVISEVERTADEILAHFRTTALYFQIEPAKRVAFEQDERRLIEALGGTVRFSRATILMTARRSRDMVSATA
jgi:SAM-dependent methyltransferase